MTDKRGPITLITSLSDERNRWKTLAYAWKGVAMQAVDFCSVCGAPALWRDAEGEKFWCESHWKSAPQEATVGADRLPWYIGLLKAMDLEDALAGSTDRSREPSS